MKKSLLLLTLSTAVLSSCSDSDDLGNKTYEPIPLTRGEEQIANAQEAFAFDMINAVAVANQGENWVISPLTDFISLSMVSNGASDETRGKFKKVLHFPEDATMTDINSFNKRLIAELPKADNKVTFSIATANWLSNKAVLIDEFNDIAKEYYNAPVSITNLENIEDDNNPVQLWYKKQTGGDIKYKTSLFDVLSVSASAVNFDGEWARSFDKKNTRPRTFNNYDKSFSSVPTMMNDLGETCVYYNDDCEMIRISYGNSAFAMSIFLPEKGKDVTELVRNIKQDYAENSMENISTKVTVYLPKFEVSSTISQNDILKAMGLDFNYEILNKLPVLPNYYNYYGNKALTAFEQVNSVFISVDEDGTVIKATSSSSSGLITSPSPVHHDFIVDRPFFYMITEKSTGSVIAAGTIYKL